MFSMLSVRNLVLTSLYVLFLITSYQMATRVLFLARSEYSYDLMEGSVKDLPDTVMPSFVRDGLVGLFTHVRSLVVSQYINDPFQRNFWILHVVLALLWSICGPLQFLSPIRERVPSVHRFIGRVFLIVNLLLTSSGFALNFKTQLGVMMNVANVVLMAMTLVAAVKAWYAVQAKRYSDHAKWVIRLTAWSGTFPMHRTLMSYFFLIRPQYLQEMTVEGAAGVELFRSFFSQSAWVVMYIMVVLGEVAVHYVTQQPIRVKSKKH